jgi:hypothetical protein
MLLLLVGKLELRLTYCQLRVVTWVQGKGASQKPMSELVKKP